MRSRFGGEAFHRFIEVVLSTAVGVPFCNPIVFSDEYRVTIDHVEVICSIRGRRFSFCPKHQRFLRKETGEAQACTSTHTSFILSRSIVFYFTLHSQYYYSSYPTIIPITLKLNMGRANQQKKLNRIMEGSVVKSSKEQPSVPRRTWIKYLPRQIAEHACRQICGSKGHMSTLQCR